MTAPRVAHACGFDPRALPRCPSERGAHRIVRLHMAADLIGLLLAYGLTYLLRFGLDLDPLRHFIGKPLPRVEFAAARYPIFYVSHSPVYLCAFAAFLFFAYALLGLYSGHRRLRHTPLFWNLLLANGFLFLLLVTALFFDTSARAWHMRGFLPLVVLLNVPCTFLTRRLSNALIARLRRAGRLINRTLLIGEGREAEAVARRALNHEFKSYRIVDRAPVPKTADEARALLAERLTDSISTLFFIVPDASQDVIHAVADVTRRRNRTLVAAEPVFLRLHNPFSYGDTVLGLPLVHFSAPGAFYAPSRLRTLMAQAMAAVALLLLSPLFLIVSVLIRLDSPGPAFFVQKRYGLDNRLFRMYKFRTMVRDAEQRLAALRANNETDGALFKMHDDPRVTRIGRFLRRTSLDELPQLINILRGEMRFVGPRPLPCADLDPYLDKWQGFRQTVPPGLTCIWQVTGRSDVGFDSMSNLDIWYAHNRNWILDVQIILRTFWTVVFGRGAY